LSMSKCTFPDSDYDYDYDYDQGKVRVIARGRRPTFKNLDE